MARPVASASAIPIPRPARTTATAPPPTPKLPGVIGNRSCEVEGGEDHERGEKRMRKPERGRGGDGARDAGELHPDRPERDPAQGAAISREGAHSGEEALDAVVAPEPRRTSRDEHNTDRSAHEHEDRPDRDRVGHRRGHHERRERQRARRGERGIAAARCPEPVWRVDRPSAQGDLDRVPELRRCNRVHHRADPEARGRLLRAQAGTRAGERRMPGADRAQERREEGHERKRQPGTACVREDVQRRHDVVPAAEEGKGGRKGSKHEDAAGCEHESVP